MGALETLLYLADPAGFLERRASRHGPDFWLETPMYGRQWVVSGERAVHEVLSADPDVLRAGEANAVLRHVVGELSVSSLDGEAHARRRRMLAPALSAMRPERGAIARAVERELGLLPRGTTVALGPALRRVTLGAMLGAIFGEGAGPEVDELGRDFARLVERGAVWFGQLGALPALRRELGPLSPWAAFAGDLRRVDRGLYRQIAARKAAPCPGRGGALGAMLEARDPRGEGPSERALRDDLFTLLGAGFETTATAIAWAIEAIALRPPLLSAIRDELARGSEARLLDAAIHESLRLSPVLPTVSRKASREVTVGGRTLPAGSTLVLCIYLAHRSPLAHPEPREFRAERWLSGRPEPHGYLPFGVGARRCPGMGLALLTLREAVGAALSSFAIEPLGPSRPVFRGSTLAPWGGGRALVSPRLGGRAGR